MTSQDEHSDAAPPPPTPHEVFNKGRNDLMGAVLVATSEMEHALLRQQTEHQLQKHQLNEAIVEARRERDAALAQVALRDLELTHRPAVLPPAPVHLVDLGEHREPGEYERLNEDLAAVRSELSRAREDAATKIGEAESGKAEALAKAAELQRRIDDLDTNQAQPADAGELAAAHSEAQRLQGIVDAKDAQIHRVEAEAQAVIARLEGDIANLKAELRGAEGAVTEAQTSARTELERAAEYVGNLQGQLTGAYATARHYLAALLKQKPGTGLAEALHYFDQAFNTAEPAADADAGPEQSPVEPAAAAVQPGTSPEQPETAEEPTAFDPGAWAAAQHQEPAQEAPAWGASEAPEAVPSWDTAEPASWEQPAHAPQAAPEPAGTPGGWAVWQAGQPAQAPAQPHATEDAPFDFQAAVGAH